MTIRGRQRRGQAMVELALALPIFLVVILGLIEGGRYVFYSETLNHAAREGARYAIIHGEHAEDGVPTGPPHDPSGAAVKHAVREAAYGLQSGGEITVPDPVYQPNSNRRGSLVTVTLSYTYTPIVPIFGPITIDAEASLVINN
ncbi:MAG TPA: TadE/TadG family type IV pilus assembly protein [Candidatus Limnocylindria bacterium]|nr:TadE/TadG family type IV pilus assembly protein [Candidatus Limnocylindria bacterium]